MSQDKHILPSTVTPTHYTLQFTPDFATFKFNGVAVIDLKVHAPTKEIKVNALELEFAKDSVKLEIQKGKFVQAQTMAYDTDRQEMTFTFNETLPQGTVTLHLSFTGNHNDKMAGFYRSSYINREGTQKYMVVTQFEATDARRAFPCWDEPNLKATFDIILHVPKEMTALSNMNEVENKPHAMLPNYNTVRFARTPVMSTYLVAFAVGEFEFIEKHTTIDKTLIPVRVYTTKGLAHQGEFALGCACDILSFFSKKFDMPYVLPKMDMLAVPDFSAGAMENWGLVTYRTVMLLVDKHNTSSMSQQRVAYVVAHELAHQWFGNIVTMQWWDELWLNEGFATWVGWYAVDHFFPSWQVWSQFVNNELGRALELDALQSSHPIQVPVHRPSEISQIFDSISYSKGASVIRMLSNWLGVDRFIEGVALYLRRHRYANAATEDLWDALNASTGKNVREFMSLWTLQVGYPVLHITMAQADGKRQLRVQQSRFLTGSTRGAAATLLQQQGTEAHPEQKPWWCPLGMAQLPGSMLTSEAQVFAMPSPATNPLDTLLNVGQSNFFRVHYPSDLLNVFQQHNHALHEVDRAGLISDAFALCIHGDYSTLVPLQLVQAETQLYTRRLAATGGSPPGSPTSMFSYIALLQVKAGLSKMKEVWALEPTLPHLKQLMRQVFGPVAKALGWAFTSTDDHLAGLLRTLAVAAAGLNEDTQIVEQALAYVAEDVLLRQVHPNLRGAVYAMAVKHGSLDVFTAIRDRVYRDEQLTMDQRLSALSALGHLQHEPDVARLLDFVIEHVRPQDWIYPFRTASMYHRLFVWRFLKQHWDTLEAVFQPSSLAHTVLLTSSWADTQLAETEIVAFFKNRNTALYDRALKQTLEKIAMQEAWLNKDQVAVRDWLATHCAAQ